MRRTVLTLALFAAIGPAPAPAEDLGGLLLRFFAPDQPVIVLQESQPFNHAAHFLSQTNAQATLTRVNSSIAAQLATAPVGASSAGFTFNFDPALGVYNRSAETFGPLFAERAITAGRGKFSFGVSHLRATYDRLEGRDLDAGNLTLYLVHEDTNRDATNLESWFEGDVIRSDLYLDIESRSTVLFATYGVTDRLDFAVTLPYVEVDFSARIHASVERLATGPDPFIVHAFPGTLDQEDFLESDSASGIGDLVLRGKYNFTRRRSFSAATGVDVRLPTGAEEDLLGSGATQIKPYVVVQGGVGRFSPHANVGYTFSSGESQYIGTLPDEFNYGGGFDAALHPRVTFNADFIGRLLLDTERIVDSERIFQYRTRTDPTIRQASRTELTTETADVNLMLGSAGLKFNPVGRLLVAGYVLFAIGDTGLQDRVTPVFSIDYTF